MNTPEEEYRQVNIRQEEYKQVNIRLTQAEIDAVRDLTKVDAIAPAVVSIVRKAIEQQKA